MLAEEAAVLEAEQLERGQHAPVENHSLGAAVRDYILLIALVSPIDQPLLDELIEDAVDDVVAGESEYDQNGARVMSVLPHEDHLVDPEADHPAALEGDKGRDRLGGPFVLVVANSHSDQEGNGR